MQLGLVLGEILAREDRQQRGVGPDARFFLQRIEPVAKTLGVVRVLGEDREQFLA